MTTAARTGRSHDAAPNRTGVACRWCNVAISRFSHSRTIRILRTSTTNTGPPISAITIPTWSSAGLTIRRPMMSAPVSSRPPSNAEYGTTQR